MFLLLSIKINKISYRLTSNAQLSVYIIKIEDDCDQLEYVISTQSIYVQ